LNPSNADLLNQLLSAFVLFAVAVLPVGALYIITLLRVLMRDTNRRAESNRARDLQRAEIAENVRRLVNSGGVGPDGATQPTGEMPAPAPQIVPSVPRTAPQPTARVVSIRTVDAAPTEPRSDAKDGI
jgi:hypothetical protein